MTVELGKKPSCINHPQGTLSIIIITLGYFKYLIVVLGILYYCICQRLTRQLIHFQEIETNNQETEDFLIKYVNDMAQNESCSICMEINTTLTGVTFECKHSFHLNCVKDWIKSKGSCPMCRKKILPRVS